MSCWEETLDGHPWGRVRQRGRVVHNVQKGQWRGEDDKSLS